MAQFAPKYGVVRMIPTYCDRDGISGWRGRYIATTQTKAWAFKILEREDTGADECSYEVRDLSTHRRAVPDLALAERAAWEAASAQEDALPF